MSRKRRVRIGDLLEFTTQGCLTTRELVIAHGYEGHLHDRLKEK